MVERANKEVMRHLRNILFDTNIVDDWEDHLRSVMSIMNHQRRGSLFPSPVSTLFGDVYATNGVLNLKSEQNRYNETPMVLAEWADERIVQQKSMFRLASAIQNKQDKEHDNLEPYNGNRESCLVQAYYGRNLTLDFDP